MLVWREYQHCSGSLDDPVPPGVVDALLGLARNTRQQHHKVFARWANARAQGQTGCTSPEPARKTLPTKAAHKATPHQQLLLVNPLGTPEPPNPQKSFLSLAPLAQSCPRQSLRSQFHTLPILLSFSTSQGSSNLTLQELLSTLLTRRDSTPHHNTVQRGNPLKTTTPTLLSTPASRRHSSHNRCWRHPHHPSADHG